MVLDGDLRGVRLIRLAVLLVLLAGTARAGDVERGRAIATDRVRGLCVLCHAVPGAAEGAGGDLGPGLAGVGARMDAAALRARIVDPRVANPATIMPAYGSLEGLSRVGVAWRGKTILSPDEIEDVVAFLATLRE